MSLFHKSIAEFIGVFTLVFAGCGATMVVERFPGSLPASAVPVVFGLAVAAMVYALGHISGAHFNPAVTVAFAVARHFPTKQVLAYGVAQILGALAATTLLYFLLPSGQTFGATLPNVEFWQAFVWETVLTFFLMFVIVSVSTDTRAIGTMSGLAIGITVMFCAFIGGPVTGASMNPARSLAPALFEQRMDVFWIYLIAPMIGAMAGALFYERIRCDDRKEKSKNPEGCC